MAFLTVKGASAVEAARRRGRGGAAGDLAQEQRRIRLCRGPAAGVGFIRMKSFLAACAAIALIAIAGAVILNTVVQEPVATAFATSGVRL